jgi:hypothetical protein
MTSGAELPPPPGDVAGLEQAPAASAARHTGAAQTDRLMVDLMVRIAFFLESFAGLARRLGNTDP